MTHVTDSRPNILWYCTDQQRFDTIAALGNEYVHTPTVDQLVEEGVAFTTAYCQSPICTPSRASFMTGMYPSRIHNTRNGNDTFPNHPPLVSKLLADSGYDCGMVGKFHLQSSGHRTEPRLDDGYRFWKFSHAPRDDWDSGHDYADWVRAQSGDLDTLRNSEDRVPPHLHQTTWATEMAIDFVNQSRDTPWLLSVNIYDPHPPFIPPRQYADRFAADDMPGPLFRESDLAQQQQLQEIDFQDEVRTPEEHNAKDAQAKYYAMIAQIDDQFARLLQAIDEAGQTDNTVVIFTSDHGESLGDHGLMYKGCRFYEGLVRVPLIFRWPGHIRSGLQSDALVELIDVTATVLDVAQVDPPEQMQGRSLVWYQVLPVAAQHIELKIHICLPQSMQALPDFTEIVDGAAAMVDAIHQEDIVANNLVWSGLTAPMTRQGRLSPLERSIWQFNHWWSQQLGLNDSAA